MRKTRLIFQPVFHLPLPSNPSTGNRLKKLVQRSNRYEETESDVSTAMTFFVRAVKEKFQDVFDDNVLPGNW